MGVHRRLNFAPFLAAVLVALAASSLPAAARQDPAAMVIDANTGQVLHDKEGSATRYPASLTKMMTLYLAFEAIEAGQTSFSAQVSVSTRAAAAPPSKIGLKAGSKISLRDAIKALIVKSANDMAVAVAEHLAGSEPAFAELMTKRARQIGMERTVFRNASGLPDPEQVTTGRDMLTLAMRLQDDFPQHYRMFTLKTFSYGGKTYRSHNSLIGRFAGVDGIKTGYTRASGFNLVSSYRAKGKHVVAVVFGGVTASLRDAHMRMLLARAIERASTTRTRRTGPQLVAEARPATRPPRTTLAAADLPQPKPIPEPVPLAALAAPAPVAAAMPPQDPSVSTPEANASSATQPTPRIAIAKVKTVSVLPQASAGQPATLAAPEPQPLDPVAQMIAATTPAETPQRTTFATAGTALPRTDFAALKAELATREAAKPSAAEIGRIPAAPSSPAPPATAPEGTNETVLPKLDGIIRPGRPPSTLQAQLASLAPQPSHLGGATFSDRPALLAAAAPNPQFGAPQPVRLRPAPAPRPASPAGSQSAAGGYHVQIGVYSSPTDAERAIAAAQAKAAHVLDGSAPIAMPLVKGDRQLYRARFAGFDSAAARSACNELRRMELDCFVARAN